MEAGINKGPLRARAPVSLMNLFMTVGRWPGVEWPESGALDSFRRRAITQHNRNLELHRLRRRRRRRIRHYKRDVGSERATGTRRRLAGASNG